MNKKSERSPTNSNMFAACFGCVSPLYESTLFDDEQDVLRFVTRHMPPLEQLQSNAAQTALRPEQICMMALVCNNLHALRSGGKSIVVDASRFLRARIDSRPPPDIGCETHHIPALCARYTNGDFLCYRNEWRIDETEQWSFPTDGPLRDLCELFQQSTFYSGSLSRCEIVGAAESQEPNVRKFLMIQPRQFASLAQYQRALASLETVQIPATRIVCRAQPRCVSCFPCVSTALLAMFPDREDFCLEHSWATRDTDLLTMRLPVGYTASQLLASRYLSEQHLWTRQHALVWGLSGVHRPMTTLFNVACSFKERERGCRDGLLLIEEVLLRAYIYYRMHATEAAAVQSQIARELRLGRLYDPVQGRVIESCAPADAL